MLLTVSCEIVGNCVEISFANRPDATMATSKCAFYSTLLYAWLVVSVSAVLFILHHPMSKVSYSWPNVSTEEIFRWKDLRTVKNFPWSFQTGQNSAASSLENHLIATSLRFELDPDIPNVDCERIIRGDEEEIRKATEINLELMRSKKFEKERQKIFKSDQQEFELVRDCEVFQQRRKYILQPMSAEEKAYPIAYIMTIHRDLSTFERLLRSIYHPQNVYCIHPDSKSDETFHAGVRAISGCFANVFVASAITSVQYTHISRVEADLNCMRDLVEWSHKHSRWRYVINLCGQDFPLKTNLEIVRYLKSLGGYNNLETFHTPSHKKRRYEFHFDIPRKTSAYSVMEVSKIAKLPPPRNTEIFAGSAYYIFKHQAVEYILTDPLVAELIEWSRDTYSPDEFLWATIQRLYPQLPGSLPRHEKYDMNEIVTLTRLVKWAGLDRSVYPKCGGVYRHSICVYGSGDLSWLIEHKHLFANKFDMTIDVFAIHCLDNWIRNKTLQQSWIYNKLGFV